MRVRRRYRPNTLILETRFETNDGAVTVIDFMTRREGTSCIVRLVVGELGRVAMCCELILRFGSGLIVPWVTRLEDGTHRAIAGPDMTVLRTPVHLRGENLTTVGEFVVEAGDTVPFVMAYSSSNLPPPKPADPQALLDETETFWTEWAAQCRCAGPWSDLVLRSLITLKALTYRPTGGIVAAPTTSLPEEIGGTRNWDYRYCWLRDATLALLALMHAGYYEEALAWREWLLRAVAGSPDQVQIMYGIAGERFLEERIVPWLPTYSKVMAWVAADRVIKNAEAFGLQGPLERWRKMRDLIHREVCTHGFDAEKGSFVQSYGSKKLDASLLLLPSVGFLPVTDPRIAGTVAAIERELITDGFVRRYDAEDPPDGLPPGEGVFLACSFWLVDVYLLQNRQREAERLFERLVSLCNDVGLLSEEYDPGAKRLIGNFPQAFTHVALVNSAFNLTRETKPVHQRARSPAAKVKA